MCCAGRYYTPTLHHRRLLTGRGVLSWRALTNERPPQPQDLLLAVASWRHDDPMPHQILHEVREHEQEAQPDAYANVLAIGHAALLAIARTVCECWMCVFWGFRVARKSFGVYVQGLGLRA